MWGQRFGGLVISELRSPRWISQLFGRLIDTIFARNSFLEWNTVRYRMRTDLRLTCCVLLHSQGNPICTVNALMAAYRRYEKREAPRGIYGASPRAISWSCFGKRGARESPLIARELHWIPDRDCLVSWKNPLLLYSRYWLYRNRRIDLVRAFSPVTKINTPHWIRK